MPHKPLKMNRRAAIGSIAGMTGAAILGRPVVVEAMVPQGGKRLKQSIAHWILKQSESRMSLPEVCELAVDLGCESVELVKTHREMEVIRRYGLRCALMGVDMSPSPSHMVGFNNPAHWPMVLRQTRQSIDIAAKFGCPNVIVFTGSISRDPRQARGPRIPTGEGLRNCVEGLKCIAGYAAEKNVVLNLESLSTRETDHPAKGFPGYQGSDFEFCLEVVKRVNSPQVKLLFDVYHVQIMNGDVLRRIRENTDWIGHVHTAGCPGRGGLTGRQEIAYCAVFETLLEVGYEGYVGHEFLPEGDARSSLAIAVALCRKASKSVS